MSAAVTALYDTRDEAVRALRVLKAEIPLAHGDVYDRTPVSVEKLRRLDLTPEERTACQDKVATGDYLLLAQVGGGGDPAHVAAVLERIAADDTSGADPRPRPSELGEKTSGLRVIAEERLPLIEEELRVGTREVVRGGARVHSRVEEVPVTREVELKEEFARVGTRPASRPVSAEELEQAGLLRDRVIEIAQVREEAVVSKEAFVREEVVVSKTTQYRVEQIHETVRHTEVETEDLGAASAGEGRN
ncbi:MAG TPA: YsnF/AvaK domain-containing protein [Allosphingosinicella sp.]|nr:YsnF/AvaK domain-containing protein [Allosphingosinicella sp.]